MQYADTRLSKAKLEVFAQSHQLMAKKLPSRHLLRIATAQSTLISNWKEGAYLHSATGATFDDLIRAAAVARWNLARLHQRHGNRLIALAPPASRAAVSRFYYCMYHAMRAATYILCPGDDHEEHSKLPGQIPPSFPNRTTWQSRLKDARLVRNAADYDPYPNGKQYWLDRAVLLRDHSKELLADVKNFLKIHGCNI
jgi:uncharacterized protein (UPF0332 family)